MKNSQTTSRKDKLQSLLKDLPRSQYDYEEELYLNTLKRLVRQQKSQKKK